MNKLFFRVLNFIVMLVSVMIFANICMTNQLEQVNFKYLMLFILLFLAIHTFRFVRIYLIVLEEKIPLLNFLNLYVKTTFVSLLFPFKSGELYKMIAIGEEISNMTMGILSVFIDRIFDMYILVGIMVPYELIKFKDLSTLSTVLLVLMIAITLLFLSFPSFYRYTNKFFMLNSSSKKSIVVLELCEKMNYYYSTIKKLIHGRWGMLSTLSIFIWIAELLEINVVAIMLDKNVGIGYFIDYLNSAFSMQSNEILNTYIVLGATFMIAIVLLVYALVNIGSRRVQRNA